MIFKEHVYLAFFVMGLYLPAGIAGAVWEGVPWWLRVLNILWAIVGLFPYLVWYEWYKDGRR